MTLLSEDTLFIALISAIVTLVINAVSNKIKSTIAHEDRTYERKVFLRDKYEEMGNFFNLYNEYSMIFMDANYIDAYDIRWHRSRDVVSKIKLFSYIYFPELKGITETLVKETRYIQDQVLSEMDKASEETVISQIDSKKTTINPEKIEQFREEWLECYINTSKNYTSLE